MISVEMLVRKSRIPLDLSKNIFGVCVGLLLWKLVAFPRASPLKTESNRTTTVTAPASKENASESQNFDCVF